MPLVPIVCSRNVAVCSRPHVQPFGAPKSVGHEHTFGTDTADVGRLEATLLDLAESVASRLRRQDLVSGAVQLKLRYEGFETLTRQAPLPSQTHESDALYDTTLALLRPAARLRKHRGALPNVECSGALRPVELVRGNADEGRLPGVRGRRAERG
mgnify:CR=1 FL=1